MSFWKQQTLPGLGIALSIQLCFSYISWSVMLECLAQRLGPSLSLSFTCFSITSVINVWWTQGHLNFRLVLYCINHCEIYYNQGFLLSSGSNSTLWSEMTWCKTVPSFDTGSSMVLVPLNHHNFIRVHGYMALVPLNHFQFGGYTLTLFPNCEVFIWDVLLLHLVAFILEVLFLYLLS